MIAISTYREIQEKEGAEAALAALLQEITGRACEPRTGMIAADASLHSGESFVAVDEIEVAVMEKGLSNQKIIASGGAIGFGMDTATANADLLERLLERTDDLGHGKTYQAMGHELCLVHKPADAPATLFRVARFNLDIPRG